METVGRYGSPVPTLVLRLWLPDRPGALGAVATRVGAVRGDVIGIDIIERGAGRAVDELVVRLPEEGLEPLLLDEVRQVDGVDVEDVRRLDASPEDPAVAALQVAAEVALCGESDRGDALVQGAVRLLHAEWSVLVHLERAEILAASGVQPPPTEWLVAFARGATTGGGSAEDDELAVATLAAGDSALVVGRAQLPLRGRERDVLRCLARLS